MALRDNPSQLLGPNGQPISSKDFQDKKAAPPKQGEAFGNWAGRDVQYATLPGGGVVQFDLNRLTLDDFRQMRDHYQINVSLAVLSFMQHQSDWHIECDDPKIAELCERQLKEQWTQLNRGLAQANWAGYSPNVLDWVNDVNAREVKLDKIKDLYPEECVVKWDKVEGWAPPNEIPPKFKVYGGFQQIGQPYPVPPENSLWYPILMENGDYTGRKLLRPAFTSWFFSLLIHLFANRYFERFGEPTPVGRAPYDEDITVGDVTMKGNQFMLELLQNLRSRAVVTLPNAKTYDDNGRPSWDYDIEYLESQMRGADFERYLTRLDEEMSLGLFTPILLMRTADVGSYNLGVGHMQVYLWMMNAMNGDRKQYIDKYILSRMVDYNFSPKAPRAKIVFRKLGQADQEMVRTLITAMQAKGELKPDIKELGEMAGMTLKEIRQTTTPNADDTNAEADQNDPNGQNADEAQTSQNTLSKVIARVIPQVQNAYSRGADSFVLSMGYKRQLTDDLAFEGHRIDSVQITNRLYDRMKFWVQDASADRGRYPTPASFLDGFESALKAHFDELVDGH